MIFARRTRPFYKREKPRLLGSLPALLFTLALAVPARADRSPLVRIGLRANAPSVVLGTGAYRLSGQVPRRKVRYREPQEILPAKNGFTAGKERWGNKITIEPAEPGGVVVVNKRPFRGAIELERRGGGIRVVNQLSVEDYVRGVLLMETSDRWPVEALKAQSVISRTYALRNRGRHGSSGYDFCPSPHCQTYAGAAAERTSTDAAVQRTRGEVLVDRKKQLVSTVYHSCCGGSTESAENVWEHGGQPYLKGVRCGWCKTSPRFHWVARVPYALVDQRLAAAGYNIGGVRAIGVLSHTPSGRVYKIRIYGERGTQDLLANTFRNIVDPALIRSTFWSGVSKLEGAWQVHGTGWGHGVGLCQWGMKTLADNSMNYGQILRFYYHRVEVVDWTE
jgi:stage II sporulation protein D